MPLFQRKIDPETALRDLENRLNGKRVARDSKAAHLQSAEIELAKCRASVEKAALGDDKVKLKAALAAKREAEDDVEALKGAAATIGSEISTIESEIVQARDKIMRSETADAVATLARELDEASTEFDASIRKLEAALRACMPVTLESYGPTAYAMNVKNELPPALANVIEDLRRHREAVLAGSARASLPVAAPEPKLVPAPPPPEPTINIFAMRNLKYVAADGSIAKAGKFKRSDLPKHLAEMALASNLALPISDPRIRDLAQTASPGDPHETACQWIGPAGKEAPPRFLRPGGSSPIHSSLTEFTPYDRGGPYTAVMSRPPELEPLPLAAGMRKLDAEE